MVDLRLIVTSTRNATAKATLIARILHDANSSDIPIGVGVNTNDYVPKFPEQVGFEWWYAADYNVNDYEGVIHQDGVSAAIDLIHAYGSAAQPIWLISIAPQGNIYQMLLNGVPVAAIFACLHAFLLACLHQRPACLTLLCCRP